MTTDLALNNQQPSPSELAFYNENQNSFLPNLKLIHGTSKEAATAPVGSYFLTLRNKPLGKPISIFVIARRQHALLLRNDTPELQSYNFQSPIFQQIVNTTPNKKLGIATMWSLTEFLIYIPEEDEVALWFPSAQSARPVGMEMMDHTTDPQHRKSATGQLIKQDLMHTNCFELSAEMRKFGKSNQAWVPTFRPLPFDTSFIPDEKKKAKALQLFTKPINEEMELEPAEATPSAR